MNYLRARSLDAAVAQLAARPARVVCGATDCLADPALAPGSVEWIDIAGIDALRGLTCRDGVARIGAASTWQTIAQTAWMPVALRDAAAGVGSRQIRVQGTLGGNLCHASPLADGVPPLLVLDAEVELASVRGLRRLPLREFLLGRRRTALASDELLVDIVFDLPGARDRTAFVKCTNRDGMALAVVSAAVHLRMGQGTTLESAAVCVGGASDVPLRLHGLELALMGRHSHELAGIIGGAALAELSPIDDVRATAAHRLDLSRLAIQRAVRFCLEEFADDAPAY
ncbi:xanthine dehydrogenase family protein subunit M [Cupriavidus sp. SW-Y-13]|uniref:FAD binding domain-containing protein n=1 Tax=Cupriavidus sp. SW-Y-13 TaxID=2653854 RepID=UPI0013662263|nr:FAD binding domain-containing protein [Cupriavidus sp. SW-Y-13]MWL90864.1 molybdopterin dehydrogenase [Cupriavidus sp. SW-Y-13]